MSDVIRLKTLSSAEVANGSEVNVVASEISHFGAGFMQDEAGVVTPNGTRIVTKSGDTFFVQESTQKVRSQYRKVLGLNNASTNEEAASTEAA